MLGLKHTNQLLMPSSLRIADRVEVVCIMLAQQPSPTKGRVISEDHLRSFVFEMPHESLNF